MKKSTLLLTCLLLFIGGCAVQQSGHNKASQFPETISAGKYYEVCAHAQPSQVLSFKVEASEPVTYDVHYHNERHGISYLIQDKSASATGTVTAPIETTYCLFITNTGSGPVGVRAQLTAGLH